MTSSLVATDEEHRVVEILFDRQISDADVVCPSDLVTACLKDLKFAPSDFTRFYHYSTGHVRMSLNESRRCDNTSV